MSKKHIIRQNIITLRKSLCENDVKSLSQIICNRIIKSKLFNEAQSVAAYSAISNEVDLYELLESYKIKKKISLPIIRPNKTMDFHLCNVETVMKKSQFNIPEPQNSPIIAFDKIDLCLMPLVGFNRKGHRLGMGGGYYDRYFENNHKQKRPTILAGIAYDFQEDDTIRPEKWDIPLDIIFTNKEVITP